MFNLFFLFLSSIKRRFDHTKLFTIGDKASGGASNVRWEVTVHVLDSLIQHLSVSGKFRKHGNDEAGASSNPWLRVKLLCLMVWAIKRKSFYTDNIRNGTPGTNYLNSMISWQFHHSTYRTHTSRRHAQSFDRK
jgi:hypothetical protein